MNEESTQTHPDELLPWYVNGSLDEDERARVEAHLAGCERCRTEVEYLSSLREQVRADEVAAPGELGLRRLRRDIRAERSRQSGGAARRHWWTPALAAAAVLVITIQGVMLMNMPPEPVVGIQPLGADYEGVVVQVRFHPTATEARIREALQSVNGVIVDGPGALGIYRIRLVGVDKARPEAVSAAIERLRARSEVVAHVAGE